MTVATDLQRSSVKPVVFGRIDGINGLLWPAGDKTWEDARRATWAATQLVDMPEDRRRHAAAYDVTNGKIVVFGGYVTAIGIHTDATLTFDVGTAAWTTEAPATVPTARADHAMCWVSGLGSCVMFGGNRLGSPYYLNDLQRWTGTDWVELSADGAAGAHPRTSHCGMASDGTNIYLIGAGNTIPFTKFDTATSTWTTLANPLAAGMNDYATMRPYANLVYNATDGYLYSFYGGSWTHEFTDAWRYSIAGNAWTEITFASGNSLTDHCYCGYGYFVPFYCPELGGIAALASNSTSGRFELWSFNPLVPAWAKIDVMNIPIDRYEYGAAWSTEDTALYVCGGEAAGGDVQDDETWQIKIASPSWFAGVDILECLHPTQDLSQALNLGTMQTSVNSLDIIVADLKDTDGKSYWGKLLATAKWDTGIIKELAAGTQPNQYIRPDDTALGLKDATGMWSAPGVGYIGGEGFSFTAIVANDLTGVVKGIYSATGGQWGRCYKDPFLPGETPMWISQYPYSVAGRRIVLYITCVDPTTGLLHAEGEELIFWAGRIAPDDLTIMQEGDTACWRLSCISLLADLRGRALATDMPEGQIIPGEDVGGSLINLQGDIPSRRINLDLFDENGARAYSELIVPQNVYTFVELADEINTRINAVEWVAYASADPPCDVDEFWIGEDWENPNCVRFSGWMFALDDRADFRELVLNPYRQNREFCHVLQALGFDGSKEHRMRLTAGAGGGAPLMGAITSPTCAAAYHPLALTKNGGKLYIGGTLGPLVFWPCWSGGTGQGDGPTAHANVVIEDAVLDAFAQRRGKYYVEYNGGGTDGTWPVPASGTPSDKSYLTISRVLNEEYEETDLGSGYVFVPRDAAPEDKRGIVKQVYIPYYYNPVNGGSPRGPFEMMLYPLLSTGSQGGYNHATYDKLPLTLSLGVQALFVDTASFLAADAAIMSNQLAHRKLWPIPAGTDWMVLMQAEAQLFGYVVREKNGVLSMVRVLVPDTDGYDVTISDSIGHSPMMRTDLVMEIGTVVNQYRIRNVHPISSDYAETEYVFTDELSKQGYELVKEIEIKHTGLYLREAGSSVKDLLKANFVGRPLRMISPKVKAPLDRTLIRRIAAGDVVRYVNPRIMDPLGTGARGVDCLATVLSVEWNMRQWIGEATLLLHAQYQFYGVPLAPSALIDISAANGGWDDGTKQLTLEALHYGEAGEPDDGSVFVAGDVLLIIERAPVEPSSVLSWQVTAASDYETDGAQILTLDGATTLTGWDADKEYVIGYADWTAVQTSQKTEGTWQANATTGFLDSGAGNDAAQRWG